MPDDLRRESEELFRYCGELTRRIGQGGITGMQDLLALHELLRAALDGVSKQEILWADEQTRRLIDKLVAMKTGLETLRQLKTSAGHSTEKK